MFCQKDVLEPKLFKEGLQEALAAIEGKTHILFQHLLFSVSHR